MDSGGVRGQEHVAGLPRALGLQGVLASEGRMVVSCGPRWIRRSRRADVAPQLYLLDHLPGFRSEEGGGGSFMPGPARLPPPLPGAWHAEPGDRGATGVRTPRSLPGCVIRRPLGWPVCRGIRDPPRALARRHSGCDRRVARYWVLAGERALSGIWASPFRPNGCSGPPAAGDRPAGRCHCRRCTRPPGAGRIPPVRSRQPALRSQAALALGRPGEARRYQERLAGLGHTFDASQAGAPSPNPEAP
jgi:hypothetical protein